MTSVPWNLLFGPLRRLGGPADAAGLTDGQLLDRFIVRHDEAAFEVLLRRHGPMVLGVCPRVLREPHDADEAFQSTFLALLHRAASINKQEAVGSWLYGTAYRTAMKARYRANRRRARQRQAVDVPAVEPEPEILWREVWPVLDEEVNRLPEKYRAPVVLCYLEDKTYA